METPNNFCGLGEKHSSYEKSSIVILPVPYDGTSSWIKGADKGPAALISASQNMELYDIETEFNVAEKGIHTLAPLAVSNADDPEVVVEKVQKKVSSLVADGKFVVMLGGEHSISTGFARALHQKYNGLSVLQLDAHADTRESYEGSPYNHACVMARVKEFAPIVQVGIRSVDESEVLGLDSSKMFFAHDIHDNDDWMQKAIDALGDDVFVTIDLDVFDPSIMPSTGTPEPGGLLWYQTLRFLEKVVAQKNVVGFDVVELCPNSVNKAPDFLAAKLVYRLLSIVFSKK
jgi:agmatinase